MGRHGLVVKFTVFLGFFNQVVFHHPVWFVCLFVLFSVTSYRLIWLGPSGRLYRWRDGRPPSLRFASSGALAWRFLRDTCSSGRCSSPVEFPEFLNLSFPSTLIWTGCFHCPLRRTSDSIVVRLLGMSLESHILLDRLFSGGSLSRLLYFQFSNRICRLGVLSKSHLLIFMVSCCWYYCCSELA